MRYYTMYIYIYMLTLIKSIGKRFLLYLVFFKASPAKAIILACVCVPRPILGQLQDARPYNVAT